MQKALFRRRHTAHAARQGGFDFLESFDVKLYGKAVHEDVFVDTITVNKFRSNLKSIIERMASRHEPVKVTRRAGESFVVMSAADWEREQETLHVLQSDSLMQQIADSLGTHGRGKGYVPTDEQVDEIIGI